MLACWYRRAPSLMLLFLVGMIVGFVDLGRCECPIERSSHWRQGFVPRTSGLIEQGKIVRHQMRDRLTGLAGVGFDAPDQVGIEAKCQFRVHGSLLARDV